jgi:hypothetical protein
MVGIDKNWVTGIMHVQDLTLKQAQTNRPKYQFLWTFKNENARLLC